MRRSITGSLLLIIAVSYLLQITTVGYEDRLLLNRFYVENGEYYRLFTVALLHGGLWHLAFNLLALYALGTPLENYFGKGRYLLNFICLPNLWINTFGSIKPCLCLFNRGIWDDLRAL